MNSTADVATAEGWFASQDGTPAIFFTSSCPADPGTSHRRVRLIREGWGHETGGTFYAFYVWVGEIRSLSLSLSLSLLVFSRGGLIDIETRQNRREEETPIRSWNWKLYCTVNFPSRSQNRAVYYPSGRNFFLPSGGTATFLIRVQDANSSDTLCHAGFGFVNDEVDQGSTRCTRVENGMLISTSLR